MDEVWATGRRHVKISKLYLKALLRRGPNIFVALAWSQAFWLVLEAAAGNESSHGYVRLSSVACYALALHAGGHLLLYRCARRNWSHHALEFLLDLVTDVVGFAWINLAEETLAQVFFVTAKNTFTYAVLACAASMGAMEIGSYIRSLLDWPPDVDETANQFDAGAFALPTSWLVTQAVHIALYGFFYRTRVENGQGGRGAENDEVNVRLAASLFLLAYAVLCSMVAARVIGGTVAAATLAGAGAGGAGGGAPDEIIGGSGGGAENDRRQSDLVLRAVEAGGPFTAALSSDVARSSPPRGNRSRADGDRHAGGGSALLPPSEKEDEEEEKEKGTGGEGEGGLSRKERCRDDGASDEEGGGRGAASVVTASVVAAAVAAAEAGRARRDSLRRGIKAYMRLTVGMMVGWAYNLWGQVEFRQEELEFRFGPALGATVYAALSTALGVCIMVRGADKLDGRGHGRAARRSALVDGGLRDDWMDPSKEEGGGRGQGFEDAVRAFHARRMLVVVGGVGLMTGWAWEEAIDLMLEALVGDSADAGMIAAKLALAVVSTAIVLGRELRAGHHHHGEGGAGGGSGGRHHHEGVGDRLTGVMGEVGNELSEPLMVTRRRDGIQ